MLLIKRVPVTTGLYPPDTAGKYYGIYVAASDVYFLQCTGWAAVSPVYWDTLEEILQLCVRYPPEMPWGV